MALFVSFERSLLEFIRDYENMGALIQLAVIGIYALKEVLGQWLQIGSIIINL